MSFKNAATDIVHHALGEKLDFLILRGVDALARDGGDIDVLVQAGFSRKALLLVAEQAIQSGWSVAEVRDIGYLTQICLVHRWGDENLFRAVKVDFFNGAAWACSGQDPFGTALFAALRDNLSETEAIGLATLIQKLLYAGYLRERDRDRIALACPPDRIKAFIDATDMPLTHADMSRGYLSCWSRWRLRAASAGVGVLNSPKWWFKVTWRKLKFSILRSILPSCILLVSGADVARRAELSASFRSIIDGAGFPSPVALQETTKERLFCAWHTFRGETVIVLAETDGMSHSVTPSKASVLHVRLPIANGDKCDDLERVLTSLSQHIIKVLRRKIQS